MIFLRLSVAMRIHGRLGNRWLGNPFLLKQHSLLAHNTVRSVAALIRLPSAGGLPSVRRWYDN